MQDAIYTLKAIAITMLIPGAIIMMDYAGLCLHC